jgi:predicted metal-dependent phosphoesterase TrpH
VSKIDLHIHSNTSDGKYSPADIVRKSAERGLNVIALTDHDTVDGIPPALIAARAFPQLTVIPGVEISTDVALGEVHVLGYFLDYTDSELKAALKRMRSSRQKRANRMVNKLRKLGIKIEWQRVQEIAGDGSVGRPHIAQAILEKGYIDSIKEAFTKYISRNGPAYVERDKMTPQEAVKLLLQANGLPVLAHPLTINYPERMIIELKAVGLVGIEVYYGSYNTDEVGKLVSLADKHGLITTGGSDYHGLDDSTEVLIGGADVPAESVDQLVTLVRKRAST